MAEKGNVKEQREGRDIRFFGTQRQYEITAPMTVYEAFLCSR